MIRHLEISLESQHGALLRLLGTIERRGWTVRTLDMDSQGNDTQTLRLRIERSAHHQGSLDTLTRHVAKLICVRHVAAASAQVETCTISGASTTAHSHIPPVVTGAPA